VLVAPLGIMARRPRIDFPGAFHHVYARGIEKRNIFMDQDDMEELHRRILKNLNRFDADCLAWAFMPNHFHLLFHSQSGNLADFMRCLMSGYSIYFNRKYERSGHLFQNRYKSSVIDTGRYLLELIRYIHLNPVRSGIVHSLESLARYRWTGHFNIMETANLPWEKYPFVQNFFSSIYLPYMEIYLAYLEEGLGIRSEPSSFLEAAGQTKGGRKRIEDSLERNTEDPPQIFQDMVNKVCSKFAVSRDRILDGRRDRFSSRARCEILRECVREKGMARRSVCRWLGITDAGGSYLLKIAEHTVVNKFNLIRD
jgi:REP element-mobilizing transposase RayT